MNFSIPPVFILDGGRAEAWKKGYNAKNNFFYIRIFGDIEIPAAILSEERFELVYKWLFGLICAAPVAAFIYLLGLFPALHIFAVAAFFMSSKIPWFARRMEYIGHGITALIAISDYGREPGAEYRRNSKSLFDSYSQFSGLPADEIHRAFMAHLSLADAWVQRHRGFVDKWKRIFAARAG
jgi:hypothetical protein